MVKHLIIAIGTTGGEVALEFKDQMAQRPIKNTYYKTCYLDTSDSLRRGGKVAENEFIHLTANSRFMENAIAASPERNPLLHEILYPHFPPPPTTGNGAGNIRYSAAATLTVPALRETIRHKISTLIDQLAVMGDKRRDISFSIIVSAVGATGSGTVELFLPLLLEAANHSGISKPNCDIIILHPMMNATRELLLANAEALYIEMAVGQNDALYERFNGRRLVIGSGGQAYTLNNLDALKKTAATLVRLTCDSLSGITQPYWDSLPNRHVLRDLETETSLPTHLSSATPITIGLSNLGQQVIQVDTVRLVSHLVLGHVHPDTTQQRSTNTLLGLFNFLQSNNSNNSYKLLRERLTENIRQYIDDSLPVETSMRTFPPPQQSDQLRLAYKSGLEYIAQNGPKLIQQQAEKLYTQLITNIHSERTKYVMTDRPLTQLRNDFKEVQERISTLQAAAAKITVDLPWKEEDVQRQFEALARKKLTPGSVLRTLQENLTSKCEAEAIQTTTAFLNALENECVETIRRLQSFIHYAHEQYEHRSGWNTDQPHLEAESDYPLYIPALTSEQAIEQYYNRVSIFTKNKKQQGFLNPAGQAEDPLALFREDLESKKTVEHFFDGHYALIFEQIEEYVNKRVQQRLGRAPLLDLLEQIDGPILEESVRAALERAQSLIPFTKEYAVNRVEEWYVTACWSNEGQRTQLEKAMKGVSETAELYRSEDPTEIVVFYLIDGLSLPAVDDLTSRCFQPFLQRRAEWTRNMNQARRRQRPTRPGHSTMAGTPIYNSYTTEQRICDLGIVYELYRVKGNSVGDYTADQVSELAEPKDEEELPIANQ